VLTEWIPDGAGGVDGHSARKPRRLYKRFRLAVVLTKHAALRERSRFTWSADQSGPVQHALTT
jgi:hypothetical protein